MRASLCHKLIELLLVLRHSQANEEFLKFSLLLFQPPQRLLTINKLVCCCARCRAYNRSRFADVPANDQRGASPQSARFVRLAAAVEEGRQAPNLVFNCSHDDDKISEVGPPQHTEVAPMLSRSIAMSVAALAAGFTQSAGALTIKECSAKYQAAKAAGTLKGQNWNDFRKTQCGADAAAAPGSTMPAERPAASPAAPTAPGNAVLPRAVSPKYSNESAGKARMHTCLDQYNANKATNSNGGLKWIQKGGGYYSECNKQLKG
jgi:hypothetical protein